MELKVWVEGIQRIVCGVTEKTTCQVRSRVFYFSLQILITMFNVIRVKRNAILEIQRE